MPNQKTPNDPDMNSLSMMAMMMVFCLGVLLMFALIPHLGLPLGVAAGVAAGIALLFAHQRFLGPGHHD